ncbi:ankyrin repeat-containing domain protein [Leptodontidium sp. 2 PMI_412]|nr:ankyrin repeat-containing domain protein [Leptodontidium sp. MPI-SDFR-AT-0119]KAH9219340.1 ankyrin repeat-containing domain protein [Leptodontidium sp. 2 PMI_412]
MKILLILNPSTNNQQNQPSTRLRIAVAENNISEVQRLLFWRSDINFTSDDLGIALVDASRTSHEEIVRLLLDAGADVNHAGNDDGSALMAASKHGCRGVMRILLEAGARVEMVHSYGYILREVLRELWISSSGNAGA